MNIFFLIGLPRSRTAWLANFLTNGDGFCFHEALRSVTDLSGLRYKLEHCASPYQSIGDADPALAGMLPEALAQFPEARWVFVRRDVDEAYESFQRAFPKLTPPFSVFQEADRSMDAALAMLPKDSCIEVHLDDQSSCGDYADIHKFCLGRPMDGERWEMLTGMRITGIAEKARASLAPWATRELVRQSQPQSAIDKEWEQLCRELCGTGPFAKQAFDWLMDLMGIALTWDHIIDGDSINLLVADRAFEAMLLKWPMNAFWLKHAIMLAPILATAVAAWRNGDRARHFDCYSEPALAVAYALGGPEYVNQFGARVHELVRKGRAENDARDEVKLLDTGHCTICGSGYENYTLGRWKHGFAHAQCIDKVQEARRKEAA